MCFNFLLTKCVLEDGFENFVKTCRNISMTEFTVKEVATFWTKHSAKYSLLEIYEIFNKTDSANLDCQMRFQ